jgi:hypothetical protein
MNTSGFRGTTGRADHAHDIDPAHLSKLRSADRGPPGPRGDPLGLPDARLPGSRAPEGTFAAAQRRAIPLNCWRSIRANHNRFV